MQSKSIIRQRAEEMLKRKVPKTGSPLNEAETRELIHELEVNQLELGLQNEELRHAWAMAEVASNRYSELYDFAPTGYVTLTNDSSIVEINLYGSQLLGRERSHIKNVPFNRFVADHAKPVFDQFLGTVFNSKSRETCEITLISNNNMATHVQLSAVVTEQGEQCFVTLVDITERRNAEDNLKKSEKALQNSLSLMTATLESIHNGILVVDHQGTVVKTNAKFAKMWQIPGDVIASGNDKILLDYVLGQLSDPHSFIAGVSDVYENPESETCDLLDFLDGRIFERISKPMYLDGEPKGRVWSFLDVTTREEAVKAKKESDNRFRVMADAAPVFIWQAGTDTLYNYFNQSWLDFTGRMLEQELGNGWTEGVHPDDHQICQEKYLDAFRAHHNFRMEFRLRNFKGEYRWVVNQGVPRFTHDGIFEGYIGSCVDITEARRTEEHLRNLSQAVEQSPVSIVITDIHGDIEYGNSQVFKLTGFSPGELLGKNPRILSSGETPKEVYQHLWDTILSGNEWKGQFHNVKKNGEFYWESASISAIKNANGEIVRFLAVKEDITERKQAEDEIRKLNETLEQRVAERTRALETINKELAFHLSEIEQFSFIATHDLQEPLLTLTNFTRLIREEYAGKLNDDGNKYIEFIAGSAARMKDLVKGLLDYSLLGRNCVKTVVDCNKIMAEVITEMEGSTRESNAKLTVLDLPVLNGYITELKLLFYHLINNAIKFKKKALNPEIIISAKRHDKEWCFAIEDNGIGINEKDSEKIFVIFRQMHNRKDYEGIGIGLAHCKKIVELHGGRIWVESNQNGGATFLFTIPVE